MTTTEKLIACIVYNYNYNDFPFWNPKKIKDACSDIDSTIAEKLDYTNAESTALSIKEHCKEDITKYVVKYMYPVWVEPNDPDPKPKNKHLLITYNYSDLNLEHFESFAEKHKLDLVILEGRTQGWIGQEIFRIKKFAEAYDKTLFVDCQLVFDKDVASLYETTNYNNTVAIPSAETQENNVYLGQRLQFLKAEALQRVFALDMETVNSLMFENEILPTLDSQIILCSKSTADIWTPITFPFPQVMDDENIRIELSIARKGYEIENILTPPKRISRTVQYVTNSNLVESTIDSLNEIPKIKAVVGMPKSGMCTAAIIADQNNVPLLHMSSDIAKKINNCNAKGDKSPILFVDDTICTGTSMANVKRTLLKQVPDETFLFFANYCTHRQRDKADIITAILREPHLLEWNLFNSTLTSRVMLDLDGVLSPDVPMVINSNEDYYIEYIANARPIVSHLPRLFPCLGFCTGRLEQYRDVTEKWLLINGVRYEDLFMFGGTLEERDSDHNMVVGKFKAKVIAGLDVEIFVESDDEQAQIITNELTKQNANCNIVCIQSKKLYTS